MLNNELIPTQPILELINLGKLEICKKQVNDKHSFYIIYNINRPKFIALCGESDTDLVNQVYEQYVDGKFIGYGYYLGEDYYKYSNIKDLSTLIFYKEELND